MSDEDDLKAKIEAEWDEIDRKLEEEFAEKRKKWNDPMLNWVNVREDGSTYLKMFPPYGEDLSGGKGSYINICCQCGKKWVSTEFDFAFHTLCPEHLREAYAFWDNEEERPHMHICDVPTEDFIQMHKNVLKLNQTKDIPNSIIGHFLMGRYYLDGFSSRSCSGRMAGLMNDGDYMSYYCGSSEYHTIMHIPQTALPLMAAAAKDENGKDFKRLWKGIVEVRTKRLKK